MRQVGKGEVTRSPEDTQLRNGKARLYALECMPAVTFHYLENLCASPEFPFSKNISWRKVKRILAVPCDAGNFPCGHNKIPDNHCEEKSFIFVSWF